jgi:hypothetical protein
MQCDLSNGKTIIKFYDAGDFVEDTHKFVKQKNPYFGSFKDRMMEKNIWTLKVDVNSIVVFSL